MSGLIKIKAKDPAKVKAKKDAADALTSARTKIAETAKLTPDEVLAMGWAE